MKLCTFTNIKKTHPAVGVIYGKKKKGGLA